MSYYTRQVQSPPMIGLIPVEINNGGGGGHSYQIFQTTNQNSQQQNLAQQNLVQQHNTVQQQAVQQTIQQMQVQQSLQNNLQQNLQQNLQNTNLLQIYELAQNQQIQVQHHQLQQLHQNQQQQQQQQQQQHQNLHLRHETQNIQQNHQIQINQQVQPHLNSPQFQVTQNLSQNNVKLGQNADLTHVHHHSYPQQQIATIDANAVALALQNGNSQNIQNSQNQNSQNQNSQNENSQNTKICLISPTRSAFKTSEKTQKTSPNHVTIDLTSPRRSNTTSTTDSQNKNQESRRHKHASRTSPSNQTQLNELLLQIAHVTQTTNLSGDAITENKSNQASISSKDYSAFLSAVKVIYKQQDYNSALELCRRILRHITEEISKLENIISSGSKSKFNKNTQINTNSDITQEDMEVDENILVAENIVAENIMDDAETSEKQHFNSLETERNSRVSSEFKLSRKSTNSVLKTTLRMSKLKQIQVQYYIQAAKNSFKIGRFDKTIRYAAAANKSDNKNAHVYKILGDCYQQESQFKRAIKNYKYALYLDGGLVEAKIQLGHCFHKEGGFMDAVNSFLEVIAVRPELTDLYPYIEKAYGEHNSGERKADLNETQIHNFTHNRTQNNHHVQNNNNSFQLQLQQVIQPQQPIQQNFQLQNLQNVVNSVQVQHLQPVQNIQNLQTVQTLQNLQNSQILQNSQNINSNINSNISSHINLQSLHNLQQVQNLQVQNLQIQNLQPVQINLQNVQNNVQTVNLFNLQNVVQNQNLNQVVNLQQVLQTALHPQQPVIELTAQQQAASLNKFHPSVTPQTQQQAEYLNNLASVKRDLGIFEEAIKTYQQALQLSPNFAMVHSNLATVLQQTGNLTSALQHYQLAVALAPNFPDAYSNMGNTYKELGKLNEATQCYSMAIKLNPKFADAYGNLGAVYKDTGNHKHAIQAYTNALKLNPNFCDAYCNLAHSQRMICQWSDYSEQLLKIHQIIRDQLTKRKTQVTLGQNPALWVPSVHPHHTMLYPTIDLPMALEISTCHAEMAQQKIIGALLNTGAHSVTSRDTGKTIVQEKYIHFYLKSIRQVTKFVDSETGIILRKLRIGFMSSDFGNHPTSHLTRSIFGEVSKSKNCDAYCYALSPDDGTLFRRQIKIECTKMVDLAGLSAVDMAELVSDDKIDILVNMNGYTKGAMTEVFALRPAPIQVMWLGYPGGSGARYMDYLITDKVTTPFEKKSRFKGADHEQRKISGVLEWCAYLDRSFFIGDHAQMFRHLNNRIVINTPTGGGRSTRTVLHTSSTQFKMIEQEINSKSDNNLAEHLALALENMCIQNKSSIQLSICGGMNVINGTHILALDKLSANGETCPMCDPTPEWEATSSGTRVSSPMVKYNGIVSSRFQYGLPVGKVVFCNFNQLYKIDPVCVHMWSQILKNVPESVLWLLRFPAVGEDELRTQFTAHGIQENRIIFTNVACKEEHCRRGCLADICLDTTLCNGHTTGLDILWTGCPMVTLPGKTFPSRIAAGQLATLGCTELIAKSQQDYIHIASKLGNDGKYLQEIRQRVWEQRTLSPLFNIKNYSLNLEAMFTKIFWRYQENFQKQVVPRLYENIEKRKDLESVLDYINTQVDDEDIGIESV